MTSTAPAKPRHDTDWLDNPLLNKGTAFTEEEREGEATVERRHDVRAWIESLAYKPEYS